MPGKHCPMSMGNLRSRASKIAIFTTMSGGLNGDQHTRVPGSQLTHCAAAIPHNSWLINSLLYWLHWNKSYIILHSAQLCLEVTEVRHFNPKKQQPQQEKLNHRTCAKKQTHFVSLWLCWGPKIENLFSIKKEKSNRTSLEKEQSMVI